MREVLELCFIDREVVVEVEPSLYGECDLLELIQASAVLSSGSSLTLSIDPVDSLVQSLQQVGAGVFIDVLLEGAVAVNVVLHVVGERLELVLDGLEVKDVLILIEPLLLQVGEVVSRLRRESERLRVSLESTRMLLVLLSDLILLLGRFRLLLFFSLHISVLRGRGLLLISSWCGFSWFGDFSWLGRGWDILFNRDLLLFLPFLLQV